MSAKKAVPKVSKKKVKATSPKKKLTKKSAAKKKAGNIAGGKAGSRKGIKNKRTIETMEKLEKLGCDPVKFNADVMMGKELKDDHCFLPTLMGLLNTLIYYIDTTKKLNKKILLKKLNSLKDDAYEGLARSETPHEYRVQMGKELIKYVAPQLKAMDIKALLGSDGTVHLHFDPQDKDA